MTRDDVLSVLLKIPGLTNIGVVTPAYFDSPKYGATAGERLAAFDEARRQLADAPLEKFDDICAWFADKAKTKQANRKHNTLELRKIVEQFTGMPLSEGEFLVAAIHLGFFYRIEGEGISEPMRVFLGISNQSLKADSAA
ncbi:hypothetical protein [Zavarzinella formosa]|uniref:hypothetical protein n=1 Tax=Zavarzinella formosa TaxID=360055 RepID=UPI0002DBAAE4|nr:hypothetical protein [Zavarzinella formosa]